MNILDQDLKKQLGLTTADLRFSDYVVNAVLENHGSDMDIDNTGQWQIVGDVLQNQPCMIGIALCMIGQHYI